MKNKSCYNCKYFLRNDRSGLYKEYFICKECDGMKKWKQVFLLFRISDWFFDLRGDY